MQRIIQLFLLLGSLVTALLAQGTTPVILDDFEGTMRTLGDGNHNLWEVYDGEGGTGSTSLTTGAAHNGSKGLQEVLTAGTLYMHFFPNNGSTWDFAHNKLVSGTWTTNFYNRMSFWVWHPGTMPAGTGNNYNVELGTYTRCKSCDPATQNAGGTHYYHFYNVLPGVWTYVIVDNHPQHSVGGPTYDPGVITSPTTDGQTWNYFDSLTRWYWNAPYIPPTKYPATFYWDTVQFYKDPNVNEDVANIASMEASYNASTNKLHVGFVRNSRVDTTYTARYAFSDIWQLGFANALLMGSVGPDGQGDYANKKIESMSLALTGQNVVYIAVQKQGSSIFRQIQLPISSAQPPPPPPTPPPPPSGPAVTLTAPAGRALKLTRRTSNTSKQLPVTINKDDCVRFNGVKIPGGLNCP